MSNISSQTATATAGVKRAPAWMFGITSIPFGVAAGFAQITMPFLLRKAGLSVESIGWYGTITAEMFALSRPPPAEPSNG